MDFKIDNESFAAAYRCLNDANGLIEAGLGNFSDLQDYALLLINKKNLKNDDSLNIISTECQLLKNRMYRTIGYLSRISVESAKFFEDILKYEFEFSNFENDNNDVKVTSYDAVSADGIKYKVDLIGEPNENTTIILLNHGAGGSYKELDSYLQNEGIDKSNAIIIRYPRDGKSDKAYKLMEEVSSKYNIPIKNCTTAGFSSGGKYAIKQMAALVAAHPEIDQPVVMLVDAYEASSKVTNDELKALGDSRAILFSVQREGVDQEFIKHDEWSNQYGINFVKISDNQCKNASDPHKAVLAGYFENGGFDYQTGNGGFRVETLTTRNGETINSYEQPKVYNPKTGNWDVMDMNNMIINKNNKSIGTDNLISDIPTVNLSVDQFSNDVKLTTLSAADAWNGTRLNAPMGFNNDGPSGSEKWYDLGMNNVVENMESDYGFTDIEYSIREDGVKLLSGKTPDGKVFKNLVMVAADVYHKDANPEGTFTRGQIVPTSLGMGIVADYSKRAENVRKYKGEVHFDIATAWHTGKYMADAYGKNKKVFSLENFEQVIPGQGVATLEYEINNNIDEKEIPTISLSTDEILNDENVNLNNNFDLNNVNYNVSSNLKPKNNTLIAHRGYAPGGVRENSEESYRLAGQSGYWGCEADVLFDNSGNLVCSHNSVKNGEKPISFDLYLDICKEYGMTPVIDLKYEKGTEVHDADLSPAILKTIEEKGMLDSCVIQTNNAKDVAYIRENSNDARIWYLKDVITDSDMKLIQDNKVECVNIKSSEDKNMYRIKNLTDNGVDVCVWNVQSEQYKNALIKNGATYVMTDYAFDVSPYQVGEIDYNAININQNDGFSSVVSLSTNTDELFGESTEVVAESGNTVNSVDDQISNNKVKANSSNVPLIYQSDYTTVNYGSGSLATHGCGITSLSMVASYYNDTEITPDKLVDIDGEYKYGRYGSSSGTGHEIFEQTAGELGLPFREHLHYSNEDDLQNVVDALKEGCVVVAKAKSNSIFTNSGHYIVLTGVTDDGKIMVNDPNKYNYKEYNEWCGDVLTDGFANGFDQEQFKYGRIDDFFIYSPKS